MTGKGQVDRVSVVRFADDLNRLLPPSARLGIAVSGGADSLALLLLSADARPGQIEAATVDHGFRAEGAEEAAAVKSLCDSLGVPHETLYPDWDRPPDTAIQERARIARYAALGRWAEDKGLQSIAIGHHADDQAETLLMRLARGAGVRGLAGIRASSSLPGHPSLRVIRPLLSWRRAELEEVCARAGHVPVQDPSNSDDRFERVRTRSELAKRDWLDPAALARSCANLALADQALEWAARQEWANAVERCPASINYQPSAPAEIQRRIIAAIVAELATEGSPPFRGSELDRLLETLTAGGVSTLRGVRCSGGHVWRFEPAAPRK